MKKAFKFMGIVLLAAGVSFAVSSCEKEVAAVPEEDVVVEETVDFEEVTKADLQDIKEATDEVKKAIESIVNGIAGLYDDAEEFQEENSYKFQSALFDLFTNAFRGTTGEISINLCDVFKTAFEIIVSHEGYPKSEEAVNAVTVIFNDGTLTIRSKEDYFLEVVIPGWSAWIEDNGKFDSGFSCSNTYHVMIGKGHETIGSGTFIFGQKTDDTTANITLTYKRRELGASYNFCPYTFIMNKETLNVWFSNILVEGTRPMTDINVQNLDEVFWALSQISTDTYSYTKEDAEEIMAAFNENVTCKYDFTADNHAQFRSKVIISDCIQDSQTGLYRVVVKCGDKIVTSGSVIKVLKKRFKKIFGDENPAGLFFKL